MGNNTVRKKQTETPAKRMDERELPKDLEFLPFGVIGYAKLGRKYRRKLDARCTVGTYLHMCVRTGGKLAEIIDGNGNSYRQNIKPVRQFIPKFEREKGEVRNNFRVLPDKSRKQRKKPIKLIADPVDEIAIKATKKLWEQLYEDTDESSNQESDD